MGTDLKATGLKEIWNLIQDHIKEKDCCDCFTGQDRHFGILNWKLVSLVLPKIINWDSKIILTKENGLYTIRWTDHIPDLDQWECPISVLHSYLRVIQSCATCDVLTKHIINLEFLREKVD